jgi:hypothetical protein
MSAFLQLPVRFRRMNQLFSAANGSGRRGLIRAARRSIFRGAVGAGQETATSGNPDSDSDS